MDTRSLISRGVKATQAINQESLVPFRRWLVENPEVIIGYDSYTLGVDDDELISGFRYGQHVDYPLVLPGNRNIEVKVTSADVIHC